MTTRRWTAVIEMQGVQLDATPPAQDLLDATAKAAAREAMEFGPEATIVLFKETKAHGKCRDRSYNAYRDGNGRTMMQFMGA